MPQLRDASGTPDLRATTTRRVLSLAAISAAVLLVSACGKADGQAAGAGGPKPPRSKWESLPPRPATWG